MTPALDLGPAAERVAALLDGVPDDRLDAPTPCDEYSLGDLLDHLMGLTVAFHDAATKTTSPAAGAESAPGTATVAHLDPGWRTALPGRLAALAEAWRDPAAWEGTATAGGVEMPAPVMATVANDELVVHGWDLARATGQDYTVDEANLRACHEFVTAAAAPDQAGLREGLFGPVVDVPGTASLLDRTVALAGRDPAWAPR